MAVGETDAVMGTLGASAPAFAKPFANDLDLFEISSFFAWVEQHFKAEYIADKSDLVLSFFCHTA